jgi:hypothetical protein
MGAYSSRHCAGSLPRYADDDTESRDWHETTLGLDCRELGHAKSHLGASWLADVLARLPDPAAKQIDELLPWSLASAEHYRRS